MSNQYKLWHLAPVQKELRQKLSKSLAIPEIIAQLLINRGITEEREAKAFLSATAENLLDPYLLKDMGKAVERIAEAIANQEKITIYGDYDVDGITACTLLVRILKRLGAVVNYYIPERQVEGYGLNNNALENIYQSGTTLVITVDCGISSAVEVKVMADKMDIVITDHHQPPLELPNAYAVINPKQTDCSYPEKNLAGVGVAFKLCQALWKHFHEKDNGLYLEDLAIVAIGTIADIVPLQGENRILVKQGILELNNTEHIGLNALLESCGIKGKADTGNIGFVLAPRLNASGRICHATDGVELLLTDNYTRAQELAVILNDENKERQQIEKSILEEALLLLNQLNASQDKVLVLAKEDWHSGVIGIVASRLVEKYYRPVIMISIKEGVGKGSCRSIPGFNMYQALCQCSELMMKFGGHKQAAGLTILPENIAQLRTKMNSIADQALNDEDYLSVIQIDALLPINEINLAFVEQLATLAPFGMGNPNPNFAYGNLSVTSAKAIGQEGKHLKLRVKQDDVVSDVVAWNAGSLAETLKQNQRINLTFVPEINEWQGKRTIQLRARDICDNTIDPITQKIFNNLAPDRNVVAKIYLALKHLANLEHSLALANAEIAQTVQKNYHMDIDESGVEKSLHILLELGLVQIEEQDTTLLITLRPEPSKKLDLMDSKTFRECFEKREHYINIGGF